MSYHLSHQDAAFHDRRFQDPKHRTFTNKKINDMNHYASYTQAPRDNSRGPTYHRNPMKSTYAQVGNNVGQDEYQHIDTPYGEVPQSNYQQIFNKDTKNHSNQEKKVYGNRSIMDYHIFSPKYQQHAYQSELMFGGIGDSLRENREQAHLDFNNDYDVKQEINRFNEAVDSAGVGVDIRRSLSTRDQVKDYYKNSGKGDEGGYSKRQSQKLRMASNRYLENYQFDTSKHANTGEEDVSSLSNKKFEFTGSNPLDGNSGDWMF